MGPSAEVIFFDAGGTLFHPHPSVGVIYQEVAARYGCSEKAEKIDSVFRKVWMKHDGMSDLAAYSNEKIEKDWWRMLVGEVFKEVGGISNFDGFFDELYHVFADPGMWRLYPGTLEVLEELKKRKKRLGVISNWDSRLFRLVEGLKLEGCFEFVLASAVFGASKPNPRIFEEGLKRMKVGPGEAVHVGDSIEDDIKGALAAGIEPVWIDRHFGDRPSGEGCDAERKTGKKIRKIHELKELLA